MNLLKVKREANNLTQKELAKKVKISERTYQRYETGERIPDVHTAIFFAQALSTTVEELFTAAPGKSNL